MPDSCPALTAQAQFKLAIGGIMGLNLSIHSGSDLQSTGSGIGFAIGGQADMSFTRNIGLVTTLYFYDGRGGSYSFTTQGVTADYSASVGYFEIEPLFKYTLPTAPIYIIGGPSLGFAVQNSYSVTAPGYTGSKGTITEMNTRFELKAGAGYIYPLSRDMRLNGQLTFGYGLTNVQSNVNWKILSFGLHTAIEFDVVK
jgi:hypothetical protein